MAVRPSALTPVDTPEESITSWVAFKDSKSYTLGQLWPTSQLLQSVPGAIIKTHADEVIRLIQESIPTSGWNLVQLPMTEIIEILDASAAKTRVLSKRFTRLGRLLTSVVDAGR